MNMDIPYLEPSRLWSYFFSLTKIPRPSRHEAEVRNFIIDAAEKLHLEHRVDEAGNVIIRKPATSGMGDRKGVILQAHLDMVPQKNSGSVHDFEKDPIQTVFKDGWIHAQGTTLGADNGVGVAAALAVLESSSLQHGPLEALFTVNEEAGMTGAMGLKPGVLRGEILLNLDSEHDGELFIGCAGGLDGTMQFKYEESPVPADHVAFAIGISGLKGGHSGLDIHLGRGNANKILNLILKMGVERHQLLLASIEGGSLRNAIPREATAVVTVPENRRSQFLEALQREISAIADEFGVIDPELRITVLPAALPERVMDADVLKRLIDVVSVCPNGVWRMSQDMPGLVETSNNMARVHSDGHVVSIECLLRSSVESEMQALSDVMRHIASQTGADCFFSGGYPGWKPDTSSPILTIMRERYRKLFGKNPETRAVHAGLECGIIGAVCPELDMISFGPTIRYPHSPDEKVHCASVMKFWDLLVDTLAAIPEKG